MQTGLSGTYVIPWAQTEIDGQQSPPVSEIAVGRAWRWTGDALRVDGPQALLPLGDAEGQAELRARAAQTARRILRSVDADTSGLDPVALEEPLFDKTIQLTNGLKTWDITLVPLGPGRKPLLLFQADMPPRGDDLWIVRHNIDGLALRAEMQPPEGVICFTPGTMIATPDGPRDIAALREGDVVQTADNGSAEILWLGRRNLSGARLRAMPELVPVRLRAGALDKDVPDEGLLVSPDHRMIMRGPRAQALFNTNEVLVTARDLVNDRTIVRDHSVTDVTYIHMILPQHEVVFANGVATESFHPACAPLDTMSGAEQERLFSRLPDVAYDPYAYGSFARRVLKSSETAILRYDF